jgi:hypothetical protein
LALNPISHIDEREKRLTVEEIGQLLDLVAAQRSTRISGNHSQ